jgi:hypothetical protein
MTSKPEKLSLEQVLRLVNKLPAEEQEKLRLKLNNTAKQQSSAVAEPHPFLDVHINIDSLAAEQGVPERISVENLRSDFWPEDEDMSEFITTLREWRQQSTRRN